jgi:hypothetical protein
MIRETCVLTFAFKSASTYFSLSGPATQQGLYNFEILLLFIELNGF